MANNLMTQLMDDFRGDAMNNVASALGEHPGVMQAALAGVLPAVIGGLVNKASTPDQAGNLLDLIKRNKLDSGPFTDASSALTAPGGINTLINAGRPLMDSIFGGRSSAVTDWVASRSGASRSSSSSLLSLALPIVLGLIARRVFSTGWSAANLMNLLGDQRGFLKDAPAGLADILSADDITTARHATEGARRVGPYEDDPSRHAPVAEAHDTAPRNRSSWLWVVPLLLLIPLLGYFLGRRDEPRRDVAVQTTPAPRAAVPRVTPDLERPVGTSSTPSALPAGLGFYRLEFDTASALMTESSDQLRSIADALKTHPQAKAEIAGYTDNAGDDADNLRLSRERAIATMNRIASFGIDRSRLTAEGYGEAHPVADNTTAEGRQRNRRVEIRLTDR